MSALAAGLIALAGCAQRETVVINTHVSERQLAPYRLSGSASVVGQGFLHQKGGGVVTCAGSPAILAPDLPPIRQAVEAARAGKNVTHTGADWATQVARRSAMPRASSASTTCPPRAGSRRR